MMSNMFTGFFSFFTMYTICKNIFYELIYLIINILIMFVVCVIFLTQFCFVLLQAVIFYFFLFCFVLDSIYTVVPPRLCLGSFSTKVAGQHYNDHNCVTVIVSNNNTKSAVCTFHKGHLLKQSYRCEDKVEL